MKGFDCKYHPDSEYRYFLYDPNDTHIYFKDKDERDRAARYGILEYLDDGWSEEVEFIIVGEITGVSTKCDVKKRPHESEIDEDGYDSEENYWNGWDEICDYKVMPL